MKKDKLLRKDTTLHQFLVLLWDPRKGADIYDVGLGGGSCWVTPGDHRRRGRGPFWGVWREFHRDEDMEPELLLPREEMQAGGRPCLADTLVGNGSELPHLCSTKKATGQGSLGQNPLE